RGHPEDLGGFVECVKALYHGVSRLPDRNGARRTLWVRQRTGTRGRRETEPAQLTQFSIIDCKPPALDYKCESSEPSSAGRAGCADGAARAGRSAREGCSSRACLCPRTEFARLIGDPFGLMGLSRAVNANPAARPPEGCMPSATFK